MNTSKSRSSHFFFAFLILAIIGVSAFILVSWFLESRAKKTEFEELLSLWDNNQFNELIVSVDEYFDVYGYDPTLRLLQAFSNYYLGYDAYSVGGQVNQEYLWNAIRLLRQVASFNENSFPWKQELYYTLAKSYYLLGAYYYERAVLNFENVDNYQNYRDVLEYLTLIATEEEDYDKAVSSIELSLSQEYSKSLHMKKIEILLDAGNPERAAGELEVLEGNITLDESNTATDIEAIAVNILHARIHIANQNYVLAQELLEPLIELEVPISRLNFYYGITLEALGEFEKARFYYRKASTIDPSFFPAKEKLDLNERNI